MRKILFTFLVLLQISFTGTMDIGLSAGQSVEHKDVISNPKPKESSINNDSSVNQKSSKSLADEDDWNEFMQFLICSTPAVVYCLYVYLYEDYCQCTNLPSLIKDNIYGNIYKGHFIPEE